MCQIKLKHFLDINLKLETSQNVFSFKFITMLVCLTKLFLCYLEIKYFFLSNLATKKT